MWHSGVCHGFGGPRLDGMTPLCREDDAEIQTGSRFACIHWAAKA